MNRIKFAAGLILASTAGNADRVYAEHAPVNERGDHLSKTYGDDSVPMNDQTDQEKLLGIENELDRSLREFDDLLLRKKDILSNKKSSQGGTGTSGLRDTGNDGGSETSGDEDGSGSPGTMSENEGSDTVDGKPGQSGGRQSTSESDRSIGASGAGRKGSSDVPDAGDDDIVARQLREAAEKETDPTLKKKLWEEYRNYKKSGFQ